MDNLWARRSNSGKLSLSAANTPINGASNTTDHTARPSTLGRRQDNGSLGRSSFSTLSSSTSMTSPTAGASSAFGLGSGAFASFGAAKPSRVAGNTLDFSNVVGGSSRTPTNEKQAKDLSLRSTKSNVSEPTADQQSMPHHLFRHSWVFWFRPPQSKSSGYVEYDKTIHAMATIETAEEFFTFYRHLKPPSALPLVSDYHLFKKGIRPIWEDDDNKRGGKWIVRLRKGVADRYWENLVFAMLGDQFMEASDEVCGAVLSVRNGEDILSVWSRTDGGRVLRIRETLKRVLAFPPDTKLEWKSHDASIQQRSALDEARKEKSSSSSSNANNSSNHNVQHSYHTNARGGSRDSHVSLTTTVEKK